MFPASGRLIVETFSGLDGSKKIEEVVRGDPSATGNNFVAAKMVDNVIFVRAVHGIPYSRTYPLP